MKRELALAFGMVRKEKRIVPIVSIVVKKTRGRKTTLLFCFLFSVSCVFYITGFSQLYFLYWLFSIRLFFPNCILYIGFSQLYWFFPIVFYILAFLNYIGFSQLYSLIPQHYNLTLFISS